MYKYKYVKKPNIIQYQISDYCGSNNITTYSMKDPKQRRMARKTMNLQPKPKPRGRPKILDLKKFKPLTHYIISKRPPPMKVNYLLRFPNITPRNLNLIESPLTPSEVIMYMNLPDFHGFFDDLIYFNDWGYFDYVEAILNNQGVRTGAPSFRDMLIFEFARIHSGNSTYSGFLRNLQFFGSQNFKHLLREPEFIPSVQDFSRMFHSIPVSVFKEYMQILLEELLSHGLLSFKVMLWDCQFVHSNASDYKDKKTNNYSDLDAGIGRHNKKFLGLGYMCSTLYLYCKDLVVPLFCVLFPANLNDKTIFKKTMELYEKTPFPNPLVLLGDAGAYSLSNIEMLAIKGIIPLINAPKNITNQNVIELREDIHVNRDFLPSEWTDNDILKLYAVRTVIERCFSHNIQVYNARRMNLRGLDEATKHRLLIIILDLLKILTSYKVGRPDLFQTFTAYSQMKEGVSPSAIRYQLKIAGYQLLDVHQKVPSVNLMDK